MTDSAGDFLLRPVQSLLDRGVQYSTTAAALCGRLEGRVLQLQPGPDEWASYFVVEDGRLLLKNGIAEHADATMRGSLISLLRLAGSDPEALIRAGAVQIAGDAEIATNFRELLFLVRPDMEEELSKLLGDPAAHEIGRVVRSLGGWAAKVRQSLGRSVGEYLTEESRDLVAAAELEEFCNEVDNVALGVERLEARLRALRSHTISAASSDPAKAPT